MQRRLGALGESDRLAARGGQDPPHRLDRRQHADGGQLGEQVAEWPRTGVDRDLTAGQRQAGQWAAADEGPPTPSPAQFDRLEQETRLVALAQAGERRHRGGEIGEQLAPDRHDGEVGSQLAEALAGQLGAHRSAFSVTSDRKKQLREPVWQAAPT